MFKRTNRKKSFFLLMPYRNTQLVMCMSMPPLFNHFQSNGDECVGYVHIFNGWFDSRIQLILACAHTHTHTNVINAKLKSSEVYTEFCCSSFIPVTRSKVRLARFFSLLNICCSSAIFTMFSIEKSVNRVDMSLVAGRFFLVISFGNITLFYWCFFHAFD